MSTAPLDWNRLRIFHAVVEAGSFTAAGRNLDLSQSAVSRQIAALETALGAALFHRHARGLVLTEQGEGFYEAVKDMAGKFAMAVARIEENRARPQGPLKITTTVAFGSAWLTGRMNKFLANYPDVRVTLVLADNLELDLCLRQADVAIRFERQQQPNLIQRHLMTIRYHVFASASYIAIHGCPTCPEDLDRHQLIVYGDDVPAPVANMNWLLEVARPPDEPRQAALRVNSVYGIYRAVSSGLGIAALPYYMSDESPSLVEILPDLAAPKIDAYFVYPEELRHSKRIAVVRDFLIREVAQDQDHNPQPAPLPHLTSAGSRG